MSCPESEGLSVRDQGSLSRARQGGGSRARHRERGSGAVPPLRDRRPELGRRNGSRIPSGCCDGPALTSRASGYVGRSEWYLETCWRSSQGHVLRGDPLLLVPAQPVPHHHGIAQQGQRCWFSIGGIWGAASDRSTTAISKTPRQKLGEPIHHWVEDGGCRAMASELESVEAYLVRFVLDGSIATVRSTSNNLARTLF